MRCGGPPREVPSALSEEQRGRYEREGLLRFPAGVDAGAARAMAEHLWHTLERRHGIRRDDPATWASASPSGLSRVARAGVFGAMESPAIVGALDHLLGPGVWARPAHWGVPLVTFPDRPPRWDVPHRSWHLDAPATPGKPAIARVFVLLAPLSPDGGGTLVVTGSHRLAGRLAARAQRALRSLEVRKRLCAEHAWFAELFSARDGEGRVRRFVEDGAVLDGVAVRVVPMAGDAGDVFLMHPFALHAPSPNVRALPRMMLTQWIEGRAP